MEIRIFLLSLSLLSLLTSCEGQSNSEAQCSSFGWTTGNAPENEFRYHFAVADGGYIYVGGGDNEGAFERFDTRAGNWKKLQDMPGQRIFACGALLDRKIFVAGGLDTSLNYSSDVFTFDLDEGRWTESDSMRFARSRFSLVNCNGKLYAIGGLVGKNDRDFRNSPALEEYDPGTGRWTRMADMPTARHGHSALELNGKILVAGGYTEEGPCAALEVYDPQTDSWEIKADMPTARGFFGLVEMDGKVYALGGRVPGGRGPLECYESGTDSWKELDPLPFSRNRFGIAVSESIVYIIGGEFHPNSMMIGTFE